MTRMRRMEKLSFVVFGFVVFLLLAVGGLAFLGWMRSSELTPWAWLALFFFGLGGTIWNVRRKVRANQPVSWVIVLLHIVFEGPVGAFMGLIVGFLVIGFLLLFF